MAISLWVKLWITRMGDTWDGGALAGAAGAPAPEEPLEVVILGAAQHAIGVGAVQDASRRGGEVDDEHDAWHSLLNALGNPVRRNPQPMVRAGVMPVLCL